MQNKKLAYCSLLLIACCFVLSCGKNKYVLPKQKMEEVLHDLYLAQSLHHYKYNEFSNDKQKQILLDGILKKHGITKEILDSSLVWYSDNIDLYLRINDSVLSSLKNQQMDLEKRLSKISTSHKKDGFLPQFYYLTQDNPVLSFELDSTTLAKSKSPDFALNFDAIGLTPKTKLNSAVLFQYTDTTIIDSVSFANASYSLHYNYPENRTLRGISGFIQIDSPYPFNVLIYNIHSKNDSKKNKNPQQKILSSDFINASK